MQGYGTSEPLVEVPNPMTRTCSQVSSMLAMRLGRKTVVVRATFALQLSSTTLELVSPCALVTGVITRRMTRGSKDERKVRSIFSAGDQSALAPSPDYSTSSPQRWRTLQDTTHMALAMKGSSPSMADDSMFKTMWR